MAVFNEPQKWGQTLGQDADVVVIPDTSEETDPSIDKIFPSVFSIPLAQGGRAIPRSVLNGLFKLVGDWIYYIQNGGVPSYNPDYDYIVGRVILYTDGNIYICIQANGISSTVVAPDSISPNPEGTDYWQKILNFADLSNFANNKADKDFTNIDNTAKIAITHNSMPSNVYDDLTVGASGSAYTAPADGWFIFQKIVTADGQYAALVNLSNGMIDAPKSLNNQAAEASLPVKKGETVLITYSAGGNTVVFRFIYAVGSESEH